MIWALLLGGLGYAFGIGRMWRSAGPGRVVTGGRAACFLLGTGAMGVALASPLDEVAHHLFAGHMGQHLILILVAAPLLVLGMPLVGWLQLLPRARQRELWRLIRAPWPHRALVMINTPIVAWSLHVGLVLFWHLPVAYDAALTRPALHALEHVTLLSSALLFWWVLFRPEPARQLDAGIGVLYLTGASVVSGMLGALLTFAGTPIYPAQSSGSLQFGLTPLEDQQVAGLLMWLPGGLVYLTGASVLFLRWLAPDSRRRLEASPDQLGDFPLGRAGAVL
jgi:putative membrane protein